MRTPVTVEGRLPLWQARNRLLRLWIIGAAVPALVLVIQSNLGKYGDDVRDVWSWFIPTTVPTIALMVGVLGGTALGNSTGRTVRKGFYDVTFWLSCGYLATLSLVILMEPFSPQPGPELFPNSNYWLTPLQGLVVAALGYLFTSEHKSRNEAGHPAATSDPTGQDAPANEG